MARPAATRGATSLAWSRSTPRRTVIQCVNRGVLTQDKAEQDMGKAVAAPTGRPDAFRFVCRGSVSAERRDAVAAAARRLGVRHVTVWSGVEFEENLRLRGEDLLRRFCAGEAFPDDREELRRFVDDFPGMTDGEALHLMAAVFDRPAFTTPIHHESSLPAFLQAIEDTIRALNTASGTRARGRKSGIFPRCTICGTPGPGPVSPRPCNSWTSCAGFLSHGGETAASSHVAAGKRAVPCSWSNPMPPLS